MSLTLYVELRFRLLGLQAKEAGAHLLKVAGEIKTGLSVIHETIHMRLVSLKLESSVKDLLNTYLYERTKC